MAVVSWTTRSSSSNGEEFEFNITLGDLCPFDRATRIAVEFFKTCPRTRLNLHYGAISGPWESLIRDEAHLIFHHVEKEEIRLESIPVAQISLIPVVAPNLLPFPFATASRRSKWRSSRSASCANFC
jgi:hypothetical protein